MRKAVRRWTGRGIGESTCLTSTCSELNEGLGAVAAESTGTVSLHRGPAASPVGIETEASHAHLSR